MSIDLNDFQEIPISKEVMNDLLTNIPSDVILVGGQALAFWVEHFKVNPNVDETDEAFISRDADFLGRREHVKLLAEAISGIVMYPPEKAMTIICGQILIVKKDDRSFMNIDVIHRIGNMDSDAVRRRAVEAEIQEKKFLVMHPLDVLISRIENYRGIPEKQNSNGLRQVKLAIEVAKEYVVDLSTRDEKVAMRAVEKIAETARSAAGSYVRNYGGAEIYDAINLDAICKIIRNENFLSIRLPKLIIEIEEVKDIKERPNLKSSKVG